VLRFSYPMTNSHLRRRHASIQLISTFQSRQSRKCRLAIRRETMESAAWNIGWSATSAFHKVVQRQYWGEMAKTTVIHAKSLRKVAYRKLLKSANVSRSYSKNKNGTYFLRQGVE